MKKGVVITTALLIGVLSVNAQCNVVCHQGTTVKTLNDNALQGHLGHGDIYISSCEDFTGIIGDDCGTLSLPKLDFKQSLEEGLSYYITDISGRLIRVGKTNETFFKNIPKRGVYFIKVEGYSILKYIK